MDVLILDKTAEFKPSAPTTRHSRQRLNEELNGFLLFLLFTKDNPVEIEIELFEVAGFVELSEFLFDGRDLWVAG